MAKQKGIIKLAGTMGDITFFQSKDGYRAKTKSAVDGSRIKNDPAYIRTRENNLEFTTAAQSGKLLRKAVRPLLSVASDGRVTSRVMKVMSQIKNMDLTSVRGHRSVANGISHPLALPLFKDLNFNINSPLETILGVQVLTDQSTGQLNLGLVRPDTDVSFPDGATHVSFKSAWVRVDFETGDYDLKQSDVINLLINAQESPVILTPTAPAEGTGNNFFLLLIEFFQEVNGLQYILKNGKHNALGIVDVA